ncbi:nuclear transport factor 2 family protein [Aliiroseovarius subalbicans]|uniref:nuclear transport factor 2 family protein n=1 Tax=Aliiroseovarius subalbicans TaxID=2925840 RepID=UPI001F59187A|nr:nuclear transport factor 2 family protein [Aliiroseovarius subalbicans]MCI2400568.1 nuclear transport factor 2 family protein [Aliiroseovarius subalbicans]
MLKVLLAPLFALLTLPAFAQDVEAIHNEIRAMRDGAIAAFQTRDMDAFLTHVGDDIMFTAMNNEVVHGKDAVRAYYQRMMDASDGMVQALEIDFDVDSLAALYADNRAAVATGTSTAHFTMRAGLDFEIPLRWSATMSNDAGAWQITGMHFSANIFDNPIDTGLRQYLWMIVAACVVLGLVLGFFLGRRGRS